MIISIFVSTIISLEKKNDKAEQYICSSIEKEHSVLERAQMIVQILESALHGDYQFHTMKQFSNPMTYSKDHIEACN